MKTYWKYANFIDALICALIVAFFWIIGSATRFHIFIYDENAVKLSSNDIAGVLIGLLGLIAAVVAFSFTAIEGKEFRFLKGGAPERQFWQIFSGSIIWI